MTIEIVKHYPTWFVIFMNVAWMMVGLLALAVIVWVLRDWRKGRL